MADVKGNSVSKQIPAVLGENTAGGEGVRGIGHAGNGVVGVSQTGIGVWGGSHSSTGTGGMSDSGVGVHGISKTGPGVRGDSETGDGVFGFNKNGTGVHGATERGRGVFGESVTYQGVYGRSRDNAGIVGESERLHAVFGVCHNPHGAGVYATNDRGGFGLQAESPDGIGVLGKGKLAARFEGDVEVTGDIRLVNADCAEEFDVVQGEASDPGDVMVLTDDGLLRRSHRAYDTRVAGVVSGAGDFKPGIVLDRRASPGSRAPIALLGKVYCKVDARYAPIDVGDLLTTSDTPGHAMKAAAALDAFGTIVGKALRPWREGQGLIPILIALQ